MPDVQAQVNDFVVKLRKRKIEGSKTTAKLTAELLRSVISQQRVPHVNQAGGYIQAIKAVGEQLIAANPVAASDEEDDLERDDHPVLSAASVAAASRGTLRPPSLQTLLEDVPHSAAVPHTYSSGGDSGGISKLR